MKCTHCGNENQPDALFCDQCGARLAAATAATPDNVTGASPTSATTSPGLCTQCGASNTPGELFCGECGAPLDAPAPEETAVEALPLAPAPPMPAQPVAPESVGEQSPPATTSTACPRCGAPSEPGDAFCAKCGAALAAPALAVPAPAADVTAPALVTMPDAAAEPAAPLTQCPSCGADVTPNDAFCDFCGAALVGDIAMPQSTATVTVVAAPAAVGSVASQPAMRTPLTANVAGPHLVVVASGLVLPLPESGEALIGREDPLSNTFPEVDLTPHGGEEGGVSRRHCKITLGEGQYAIQDLNSTNSTWLNRTRLQPGLPVALHDGDEIRAGRVRLQFRAG